MVLWSDYDPDPIQTDPRPAALARRAEQANPLAAGLAALDRAVDLLWRATVTLTALVAVAAIAAILVR